MVACAAEYQSIQVLWILMEMGGDLREFSMGGLSGQAGITAIWLSRL